MLPNFKFFVAKSHDFDKYMDKIEIKPIFQGTKLKHLNFQKPNQSFTQIIKRVNMQISP